MTRIRKTVGALGAATFVMSLVVLAPTPAAARHVNCGVIDETTPANGGVVTLPRDVLNCEGYGLIVRRDNITLNLNGHTVSCDNTFPEQVGILLDNVTGVTVTGGTVEGCDAGIAIEGGGGNTVERMIARNNINDMVEPFDPTGPAPVGYTLADILCDYGDGILTFNSSNNVIQRNWVHGNGPYSGISMVEEGSDGNIVRDNHVEDNNVLNNNVVDENGDPVFVDTRRFLDDAQTVPNPNYRQHTEEGAPGAARPSGSLCGATLPGTPGMQRGRTVQDIGVRIEGPGADNNVVQTNQVRNNSLVGISVHSHVCNPQEGDPRGVTDPNVNNRIDRNVVTGTGNETVHLDSLADGIGLLAQGPIGNVTCGSNDNIVTNNQSNDNRRHGISVNADNANNTVRRNQVNNNDMDGLTVSGGAVPATDNLLQENRGSGNGRFDGSDFNENCDNNRWIRNQFVTVNQECVDEDAQVVVPPAPGPSLASAAPVADTSGEDTSGVNRGPRSS